MGARSRRKGRCRSRDESWRRLSPPTPGGSAPRGAGGAAAAAPAGRDRGGAAASRRLALPQSKKTRALLAYLVVTQRPQRRDRLCGMLWDVADDPRAALRWSLSKLRPLVDEPGAPRLVTSGATVGSIPPARASICSRCATVARATAARRWRTDAARRAGGRVPRPLPRGPRAARLPRVPDLVHRRARGGARACTPACSTTLVERLADGAERGAAVRAHAGRRSTRSTRRRTPPWCACSSPAAAAARRSSTRRRRRACCARSTAAARCSSAAGAAICPPRRRRPPRRPSRRPCRRRRQRRSSGGGRSGDALRGALDACGAQRSAARRAAARRARHRQDAPARRADGRGGAARRHGARRLAPTRPRASRPYGPWIDALRRLPAVAIGDQLGGELAPLLPELGPAPRRGPTAATGCSAPSPSCSRRAPTARRRCCWCSTTCSGATPPRPSSSTTWRA